MADVAQKESEQHENAQVKDDSPEPDLVYPIPLSTSRAESQSPISPPPSKEAISTMYQHRQKCELRRLLKHTCPEMKGLGNIVDEEFADILNSGIASDIAYGGEVQSRRWIFENGPVNTGEFHQALTHCIENSVQGGLVIDQLSTCPVEERSEHGTPCSDTELEMASEKACEDLTQEENFRVDVKATRKMFEGQSVDALRDSSEDMFPGRVVVTEEEKGAVQKQKRDFETCQNDPVRSNCPLNLTDTAEIGQDGFEAYTGISKAKEIFEKGSQDKENSASANENSTEDEIIKTNVKNRAQMFESTPLDRINWQNEAELDTVDKSMNKTLTSLHNFNVLHSHGTIVEASEAAHVRKAKYIFIQDIGPEIQHEEIVMGSMKSTLLHLLTRVNLNSLIAFLKEDDQGNMEIKNIDVPTHQLPFTVNQDKECRTTIMIQVIEDLLGQETSPGKGVLIQECEKGSVETLVYILFRHDGYVGTDLTETVLYGSNMANKEQTLHPQLDITLQKECVPLTQEENFRVDVKATRKMFEGQLSDTLRDTQENVIPERVEEQNDVLLSRKGDDTPPMHTPPPPIQNDDAAFFWTDENRTGNVKLLRNCIEKGELDYLKSLRKSPSDEDLRVISQEREQNVIIAPGNVETIKALFANPYNASSSLQSDNPTKQDQIFDKMPANKNNLLPSPAEMEKMTESKDAKSEKFLYNQDKGMVAQAELVHAAVDDELSNLQAAILSLQQATEEAKALQQSIQEKQQETSLAKPMNQITAFDSENQSLRAANEDCIKGTESSQNSETGHQQEEREETMKGSVQAALDSLGQYSFNVAQGDFKAAMIYRNSGKAYARQKKITVVETAVKQPLEVIVTSEENIACLSSPLHGQVTLETKHEGAETSLCQGHPANKLTACAPPTNQTQPQASIQKSKKNLGPKPAIPPKPDHLKTNPISSTVTIHECATNPGNLNKSEAEPNCVFSTKQYEHVQHVPEQEDSIITSPERSSAKEQMSSQIFEQSQRSCQVNVQSVSETVQGFQTALQNFGMKTGRATPPVKPKRIKMATNSTAVNPILLQDNPNDKNSNLTHGVNQESKDPSQSNVTMREKKVRNESEEERRQRLSVHMDEIMKGNASAALEIFDQLRKQEELKNILSKVEEIEEDSSQKHESDLRKIFESVPEWVVPQKHLGPKSTVVEKKVERSEILCDREMMSSMQVAYGDLEKASAAIITLKEQTLSRLMDIEETIKKALYSVSTLKSDSDIAGLSGLFKESMMAVHSSPIGGNIRKISIGSSKSPKAQSGNNLDIPKRIITEEPELYKESLKPELSLPTTKPRSGSPSSPSFISIQSAARKNTEPPAPPKPQSSPKNPCPKAETFQSTTCYNVSADHRLCCITKGPSCCPANEKRQVSTLEVQTAPEGEKIIGTKTVQEKYEEADCFGNKFYSSKTSTVMTTQPETSTCFKRQIMSCPATSEVVTFPRINIAVKGDQASA